MSKINNILIKYNSSCFFSFNKNKANNKGNNLDKYDPKINSLPKKDDKRPPNLGSPKIFFPVIN